MKSRGALIGMSWLVIGLEPADHEFSRDESEQQKQKNKIKECGLLSCSWMKRHNAQDLLSNTPANKQKVHMGGQGKFGHESLTVEAWRFIVPFPPFL